MKVAIIGAGFGGLNAARSLEGADVEVTLIDRNNFHTHGPAQPFPERSVDPCGLLPAVAGRRN